MFTDFIGSFKIVSANNNLVGKKVTVTMRNNERVFVIHNFAFGMDSNCSPSTFGKFVRDFGLKLEKIA